MHPPEPPAASLRRLPVVGVLGSGRDAHAELAAPLGRRLAALGVHLLTGGGSGVMREVSRAFVEAGDRRGQSIGIVPGEVDEGGHRLPDGYPNPYVELAILTHLPDSGSAGTGFASRNHLNVLSSDVLVALPGSAGTSSEVKLAMRYARPLIALVNDCGDIPELPPEVPDTSDPPGAIDFVAAVLDEKFGPAWRGTTIVPGAVLPAAGAKIELRAMEPDDWPRVREIYEQGIAAGGATFETAAPEAWPEFARRTRERPRLVALDRGEPCGWAVLHPVSERPVYRGVAEVSVYVDGKSHGRGIGRTLLERLVMESEAEGVWTLQAVVFPENAASLALHAGAGFRVVGRRERLGRFGAGPRCGEWGDVLLLERRGEAT